MADVEELQMSGPVSFPAAAGFRAGRDLERSLCNYTSLRGIYSSLREYNELRPYYTAKEPATS